MLALDGARLAVQCPTVLDSWQMLLPSSTEKVALSSLGVASESANFERKEGEMAFDDLKKYNSHTLLVIKQGNKP